jgi:hypothetical protein
MWIIQVVRTPIDINSDSRESLNVHFLPSTTILFPITYSPGRKVETIERSCQKNVGKHDGNREGLLEAAPDRAMNQFAMVVGAAGILFTLPRDQFSKVTRLEGKA